MNEHFWLEQVLEAIESGVEPEAALAQVPPEQRAAVRAALDAALWLQGTAAPALHAAAEQWTPGPAPRPAAQPATRPRGRWSAWPWARWAWAVALLLVVLLGTWGTAHAATGALPGQWAYPFKRAAERVRWTLTRAPEARLHLALDLGDTRLDEAQRALQGDDPAAAARALELYAAHLDAGRRIWEALTTAVQDALRAEVRSRLDAQAAALDHLPPSPGTAAAQRAARQAQAHFRHAVAGPGPRPTAATPTPTASATLTPTATRDDLATATPTPTPTPGPTATPTPVPDDAARAPADDGNDGGNDDDCVSRGRGNAQNQCVPADQGQGNDDNPANSGAEPPGNGPPDDPGQGTGGNRGGRP